MIVIQKVCNFLGSCSDPGQCDARFLLRERLECNDKASHRGQRTRRQEFVNEALLAVDGFQPKTKNPEPRDYQKINWVSNLSHVALLSRAPAMPPDSSH